MKYYIPKNTPIWRRVRGVSWMPLVSTRSVTYDDTDLLLDPAGLSDGVWVFRLPASAQPYVEICVEKQDVAAF